MCAALPKRAIEGALEPAGFELGNRSNQNEIKQIFDVRARPSMLIESGVGMNFLGGMFFKR